ncbi:endo-beta-N-acetylglucosaminidase H [Microbacterium gorillae]|uniref:endo-beta-N-acetylglucosaminidase H n=1 Tax=Microbacterium gorillae TaxID=1231063 RepID=UPI000A7D3975|nr:endo-beta-N-acetylglucosaminidase H [Microbacterium gorillae]
MPSNDHPSTRLSRAGRLTALAAVAALGLLAPMAATAAHAAPDADGDGPQTVVYVEVNDNDFANVADYTLAGTDRPTFDIAAIFAANINYDGEKAYLHLNERVTETLENADTQIRPVQARGTKVLLSILGNHQGAGFANFASAADADAFAAQLADAVQTYGLDGIDFDDEWTEYGVNGTGQPNESSFVQLVTALRDRLGPDKLITFYNIGPSAQHLEYGGARVADAIDYAWNPYYGSYDAPVIPGMANDRLGAAAVDLSQTSAATALEFAQQTVADGYGAYVTYNLTATDQSAYLSGITQTFHGLDTVYKAEPGDSTAPTATVIDARKYTKPARDGAYKRVAFTLADEGGLASASVNGHEIALNGVTESKLTNLRPGCNGARFGENTLAVTDLAGNTTTVTFTLARH